MISKKFPGKLFIIGEYFIMEPHQKAVIAAMNKYLTVDIRQHDQLQFNSQYGSFQGNNLPENKQLHLSFYTIETAFEYLEHISIVPQKDININIESELLYDGKKIGLGSSGVLVVSILWGILTYHKVEFDNIELFKLAVLVQKRVNDLSSGGDIAAAIYQRTITYERYDADWLSAQTFSYDLIKMPWPKLKIKPFIHQLPKMTVAWSEKENNTSKYLEKFMEFKEGKPIKFNEFKKEAQIICDDFVYNGNLKAINLYRELMISLEQALNIAIETPSLKYFIEYSNENEHFSKVSGSGGGDCAISFGDSQLKYDKQKIKILDIGVCENEI